MKSSIVKILIILVVLTILSTSAFAQEPGEEEPEEVEETEDVEETEEEAEDVEETEDVEEEAEDAEDVEEQAEEEIVPPELLYEEEAEYTEEAVEARVEGDVILELEIDRNGDVKNVEIVEDPGYGLGESAKEAAENFAFSPAMIDGEPISVVLPFRINFSLPRLPAEFVGRLADPETDEGIEDAEVSIEYTGDEYDPAPEATTYTDADGAFSFRNVPPGPYAVSLRLDEYRDFETDIDLVGGDVTEVDYSVPRLDDNVVGEIREAGTRTPLAAMELSLIDVETQEPIREEFSEAGGRFSFRGVPPGEYILRVQGSDYVTASFELDVAEGELTTGNFYVRAENYDGLTVRTTERRERSEVNRQTIGLEEVRRMPGAGSDVVRVVQNLPGVARPSFIGGQPVVRGAAPEDTQIFLGGDSIPLAYHFLGGPAVINTEMVESVDFYPGNFSARFGRAIGGIIDLQTRSPKTDRFHGMVEVDLIDSSAIVEGPINDNWSIALSGRRSYYDFLLPTVLDAVGTDAVVTPRYYDYQSWVTYRSDSGNHKLEFFLYGSDDSLELILPDGEPEGDANIQIGGLDFGNSFHRGQVRWEWDPESLPLETTLMTSIGVNQIALEAAENLYFDLNYYQSQTRYDATMDLADNVELRAGIDAQIGNVTYDIAFPETDPSAQGPGLEEDDTSSPAGEGMAGDQSSAQILPAVYTELDYELFDRWTLTPGLRVDYYGPIRRTSVSPRFATRFDVTDEVTVKGGVGLFTQPPIPGQSEEEFGNPDLTFDKAMHYAVGAEWRPLEYVEVDSTLFYRDSFDLVSPTSAETIDEEGRRIPQIYDNSGLGRAYGWELLLRHYPRNKFFGWVSYTLSRSERFDYDTDEWELYSIDQTHILTLLAGYDLPWNLDISARFRLVTGNPDTPVVGAAFDADSDSYQSRRGAPNSVRSSTFHQLDLRLDRRFVFDTWLLSAYLDISNVYNATNQEGTQYNYDYTESAPVRGLPFLPTIGVMARF